MTALASPPDGTGLDRRQPRVLGRTWLAVIVPALMVASEYRFGSGRSQEEALSGQADSRVIVELVVYALATLYMLFYVARPPTGRRLPALMVVRWGFTLSMLFVAFWSPYPKLAIARGIQMVITTWLCMLIASEADRDQLWRMAHAFIILVAASVVAGAVLPRHVIWGTEGRFSWFSLHPNVSGGFMAFGVVTIIAALLLRRQHSPYMVWPQWAYICLFLLVFGGLLASRSRGSLAAAVVGIGVVMWSASRRRSRLDLALVSFCLFGCVWMLAKGDIADWLTRGESSEQISSLNSRTEVWEQGWELFHHRPWFGQGFMSARGVFLENFGLGGAHNAFFEVLVSSGVFGTFWWLALLFLAVRGASRMGAERLPDGPLLLGMLCALMVNAFTDGGLGHGTTVHGFWLTIAVGWIVAANRWRQQEATGERQRWARPIRGDLDSGPWTAPSDVARPDEPQPS
jgi:O-antigen ligase